MENFNNNNMKRIIIAALLIAAALPSKAQTLESSLRYYDEGKLTWDDFNKRNTEGPDKSSISTSFHRYTDYQQDGNLKVVRTRLRTALNKETTWVRTGYVSDKLLRYNQVVFDLAEATTQEMQKEIDLNLGKYSYDDILEFYREKYTVKLQEFKEESDNGENLEVIERYENELACVRDSQKEEDGIPEFELKNWGYSYYLGFRTAITGSKAAFYLRPTYGMSLGFDVTYKRALFNVYMGIGSGKIGSDMHLTANIDGRESDLIWPQGERYNSTEMDLMLGYSVIDNSFMRLAPVAGVGMNSLSHKIDDNDTSMNGLHLTAGLDINWKIRRTASIAYTPWWGGKTYGEFAVKTKLFAGYTRLPGLDPLSINLAICIDFYGRSIK